jgi:plastocyanin
MKSISFLSIAILSLLFASCKKEENPGTNEVFMNNSQFTPASMTISVGTTVKWTNKESATHTVISDTGIFTSGDLDKDQSFSFTFNNAGTFPYHCSKHANMTGSITVQ